MKPVPAFALPAGLKCPLLDNLPPADLQLVLGAATRRRLTARQVLLHGGDPADTFFVLLSGRGCVYTFTEEGQRIIFSMVEPGQTMGAAAFHPKSFHYLMNTEIVEDGEALEWKRPVIRGLIHRLPSLVDSVLMLAADLVQQNMAGRLAVLSQTVEQRLAKALVELAQNCGRPTAHGVEVRVTNEQLADTANVSPFTVARTLSQWSRTGAIRKRRGTIEIRSLKQLIARHLPAS